jgi:hypothetical protein
MLSPVGAIAALRSARIPEDATLGQRLEKSKKQGLPGNGSDVSKQTP